MYKPKSFEVADQATIDQFIYNNSFDQLISIHKGQLFSTHIPFLYTAQKGVLTGHVAKANPQHLDIQGQAVMVSLSGAHGYISPTWYASKSVPTWNYQAAHIYGQCSVFNNPERLMEVVDSLTTANEKQLPKPWQPVYQSTMLKAIVGLEIKITKIDCKFKLSQN